MKKMKVKLSELKIDPKLIFIRKLNDHIVRKYKDNYLEGAVFPLIIVEEGTNRIVSGMHRYHAMLMAFGENYEIEVIVRSYKTEKEVLIDFAEENLKHGYPIEGYYKKLLVDAL
jgi:hypothetical protein